MRKYKKHKFDEMDEWERQAFLEEKEKLYHENIERIRANGGYTNREIKEFISFSKKFDNPTAAILLLHNCHVIRMNKEYYSEPIKIVAALKAALGNDFRTSSLEKATEILSSQASYVIKPEELERKKNERKLKARLAQINKENDIDTDKKTKKEKQNGKKENKNENGKHELSETELKKIEELEKRFGRKITILESGSEGNAEKDHFNENTE